MSTPRNIYEPGYFDANPPVDPATDRQTKIKLLQGIVHDMTSEATYMHNDMAREWAAKRLSELQEASA